MFVVDSNAGVVYMSPAINALGLWEGKKQQSVFDKLNVTLQQAVYRQATDGPLLSWDSATVFHWHITLWLDFTTFVLGQ